MPKSFKDDKASSAQTTRSRWSYDHIPWNRKKDRSKSTEGNEKQSFTSPEGEEIVLRDGEEIVWINESVKRKRIPYVNKDGVLLTLRQYIDQLKSELGEENSARLQEIDPELAQLYWVAVSEIPDLEHLILQFDENYNRKTLELTGGFFADSADDGKLVVTLPVDRLDFFMKLIQVDSDEARARARFIGVSFEKVRRDPRILRNFAVLCELGHAADFLMNYLERERDFDSAYTIFRRVRGRQLNTLPLPGCTPVMMKQMYSTGELEAAFLRHRRYFQKMNIKKPEQLFEIQQREYQRLPCQMVATSFAARVLRAHKLRR